MDLADTRPAELAAGPPGASLPVGRPGDDAPVPPPRRRGRSLRVALLLLLVLALIAGAALLAHRSQQLSARDGARQGALQAARQEAVNLTTIDYRTASRDLERIIGAATGALRDQFAAQRAKFPDVLRSDRSVSKGDVLASALISLHGSDAQVMVAADAEVTNADSEKAKTGPVVKHYRMVMKLTHRGGRWLVSDVAFAGLPQ